jgi:His-Xaa-Ser system radical SAM maturase HxsC
MICLKGNVINIKTDYLVKVEKIRILQANNESYLVYFLTNQDKIKFSFENLYITNSENPKIIPNFKNRKIIFSVDELDRLKIGDVVLVNTEGEIIIYYQKKSNDNIIFITQACNCNCIMCPQPPNKKEKNYTNLNINLIKLIDKKTEFLALTGGEPKLQKEELIRIIKGCKNHLPNTSLILLTNGVNFEEYDFTKELVSLSHPNLTIAVSLQSDIDEIHNMMMGKEVFYKALEGIYNLARFKQKIEIRIVITKLNYQRLKNFAEFIYYNFPFIYHIALMGLEPIGNALKNIDRLWVDPYEYKDILKETVQILHQRDMFVSIYNHQLCTLSTPLWQFTEKSISRWKNIYLDLCERCDYKNDCGGFFSSSRKMHSSFIHPLLKNNNSSESYCKLK